MQNRVVEITTDGAMLNLSRGFLSIRLEDQKLGQVAIDDMAALIVRGYGCCLSVNICTKLAEANIPIVICGSNQSPASVIWPVEGHFAQGLHMQAQAVAQKPLQKRLWAQIIRSKIEAQANVLKIFHKNNDDLFHMAKRIKSGDSDNLEAQAARRYWPRLMGEGFKRERADNNENAALNYGYMVLRAAAARSILAAGLHPSLSIHHQSRGDALRLADDLMEPFRPWVDYKVYKLFSDNCHREIELGREEKAEIISVLQLDFEGVNGASPLQICLDRMAKSLVQIYMGNEKRLEMPAAPIPIMIG